MPRNLKLPAPAGRIHAVSASPGRQWNLANRGIGVELEDESDVATKVRPIPQPRKCARTASMSIPKLRQYQAYRNTQYAQGLLELISCNDDLWGIDPALKKQIAERALEMLRQSRPRGRYRAQWLHLRGRGLRITGHYRAAIKSFRASLKLEPERIAGYLSLAWCLKRIDRIDQSIIVLNKAIKRAPQNATVRYNQACYLSLAGQPQMAAVELAIALELNPDLRSRVSREVDFDPIRQHPAFDAALQVIV